MANTMMCPQCQSLRVTEYYGQMKCLSCGYTEELIDFPCSWDWHRHYSVYYMGYDPGSNEPPEHTLEELAETLLSLEGELDAKVPSRVLPKQWDSINQLKGGFIHLQKELHEHLDKVKRKATTKEPKGAVQL